MSARDDFYSGISQYQALVVGTNKNLLNQLRGALKSVGFTRVTPFHSYREALSRAKSSSTTHILFELLEGDTSPVSFVDEIVKENKKAIIIVISSNPGLDNVFDLLRSGARGFLVPPPTMDSLEAVFISATSGSPISETILKAEDRNEAFASMILNNLYRLASTMKLGRESESAARAVNRCFLALQHSVMTARMFCENGDEALREKIVEGCIERGTDTKTRLGALRKSLHKQRQTDT